jgi:hypothetical protein
MISPRFASSVLLGLIAGTLGTFAYVAGRRRLRRYRGRPLALVTLDFVLLNVIAAALLCLVFSVNLLLARVRANYIPPIMVISMFVPVGIARAVAERRARRERRSLLRDLR